MKFQHSKAVLSGKSWPGNTSGVEEEDAVPFLLIGHVGMTIDHYMGTKLLSSLIKPCQAALYPEKVPVGEIKAKITDLKQFFHGPGSITIAIAGNCFHFNPAHLTQDKGIFIIITGVNQQFDISHLFNSFFRFFYFAMGIT